MGNERKQKKLEASVSHYLYVLGPFLFIVVVVGSPIEISYSMMTFGVSCHTLLQGVTEIDKRRLRNEYVDNLIGIEQEKERQIKQEEMETGIVVYPKRNDVLVGRGRPVSFGCERFYCIVRYCFIKSHVCFSCRCVVSRFYWKFTFEPIS